MTTNTTPRVYVGTYAKYNAGSIKGEWLDLENYATRDDFYTACRELHKDEADPEFMFQDHEGVPSGMITESSIDEGVWEWLALDDDDKELLAVYQEHIDQSGDIDTAREAFAGKGWNTKADWAEEWLEDTGSLADMPANLRPYFNYDAWARDAELGGDVTFIRHDGELWVFNNH